MEFTGGIHYGEGYYAALNATWPLAHLNVGHEKLELDSTFFRSFTFAKPAIARLSKYSGFFSTGLRIEHEIPEYPPFIVFWTFSFAKPRVSLIECGYDVHDGQG